MLFSLENCRHLTEKYEKLSADEQLAIELLSVFYTPASHKKLLQNMVPFSDPFVGFAFIMISTDGRGRTKTWHNSGT